MRKTISGFTIVELLIVIVVIGVLAAVSVVAFNGISERAKFASMRTDLTAINKLIQLYHAQNGSYPITPATSTSCSGNWCGWDQANGDGFIPGIVPAFAPNLPQLPTSNVNSDTYLYRSPAGTDYKLIRLASGGSLSASEQAAFADLRTSGCSSTIDIDRWGYYSSSVSRCW